MIDCSIVFINSEFYWAKRLGQNFWATQYKAVPLAVDELLPFLGNAL